MIENFLFCFPSFIYSVFITLPRYCSVFTYNSMQIMHSSDINFVGRIKGAKDRFDLQFLTWDFS